VSRERTPDDEPARFDPTFDRTRSLLRSYQSRFDTPEVKDLYGAVVVTTDRRLSSAYAPADDRDPQPGDPPAEGTGSAPRAEARVSRAGDAAPIPPRLWFKPVVGDWDDLVIDEDSVFCKCLYYFGDGDSLAEYREIARPVGRVLLALMSDPAQSSAYGRLSEILDDLSTLGGFPTGWGIDDEVIFWTLALHRLLDDEDGGSGVLMERWTRGTVPLGGYDLRLRSWGDGSGVPASGKKRVIVGIDDNGRLHIRSFDADGKLTDTDETERPPAQAGAIAALKQRIPGLLPPHVLTSAETTQLQRDLTSILGQTPQGPRPAVRVAGALRGTERQLAKEFGVLTYAPVNDLFFSSARAIELILDARGRGRADTGDRDRRPVVPGHLGLDVNYGNMIIKYDKIEIPLAKHRLSWGLFLRLYRNGESYCPPDAIKDVWVEYGRAKNPSKEAVDSALSKLRDQLSPLGIRIENAREVGWRLTR
jgi:hypothetical protein